MEREIKKPADFAPVPLGTYTSSEFSQRMLSIGLTELPTDEIFTQTNKLVEKAQISLARRTRARIVEGGMAADGGFAAFRTGIPRITPEIWQNVEEGTDSYVASVGGTNFKFHHAIKENGLITTRKMGEASYGNDRMKRLTYREFVSRIVDGIAEDYNAKDIKPDKLRLGVSIGFPHSNVVTSEGVDAVLEPIKSDGTLVKQWKITDWEKISEEDKSMTQAIKKRFEELGIDPSIVEVSILNDTPATALDINAITDAHQRGLTILPVSAIGGTGTNHSAFHEGELVNMETGRGEITDSLITTKMLENIAKETGESVIRPELEHEIGGKYIIERVRAAIEIMSDSEFIDKDYARALSDWIQINQESNPELVSQLARGETEINDKAVELLAQQALKRAAQFFGLTTAAIAEALIGERPDGPKAAVLTEGSFVNRAKSVRRIAEHTAATLYQPIEIIESSSVIGVAALSMSREFLPLAA